MTQAGAQTAFSLVVTALLVLLVVLFAGPAFAVLPTAVLGALIISAVWSLIDVQAIRRVWRFSKPEAITLFLTLFAVLGGGLQIGIATGALAGLALYLHGTSRPRVTVEGRLEGTQSLRSVSRDDVVSPGETGWIFVRVDESLYFGNANHVTRCIAEAVSRFPEARRLLLDLKTVDTIDYTALESLDDLIDALTERDFTVRFVATPEPIWQRLIQFGIVERCGGEKASFATEQEALAEAAEE